MPKPKKPEHSPSRSAHVWTGAESTYTISEQQSLFRPGDDNTVKGEIVVKLSTTAAASVTASIPTGPLGSRSVGVPNGFGIPEVDAVLRRFGARAVSRHPARS